MTWFETLTGFAERSPQQVRENMTVDGELLKSHVNGKVMICGQLETPSLAELRERVLKSGYPKGKITLQEVVANVQDLHINEVNANSLFQVASQFNLLEMTSPNVTPEYGVGIYENDFTQGPACAVAAGAGTIYRNYFVKVNGQIGQSATNQIDCLKDIGAALGNQDNRLWEMRNGYALPSRSGLAEISNRLEALNEKEFDELRKLLRIGIQWHTQVTLNDCKHKVSQAYCSALPVAYSDRFSDLWTKFAQLVLEASYEATICSAILNWRKNGNNKLFLTLLGGGAFGNQIDWIVAAIQRALNIYKNVELDVAIVSYGSSKPYIQKLVNQYKSL
ncbi:hypothetical protein ACN23B_27275 (plasmid) [Anabaena sp. FACHB-709]|uniref:Uncharacterized protein n=2 Tax=Nostocaceae TaxID=1162 RepID=A0A1Z4KV28_ANAVA|nr:MULTISPECIES: hypothetical protein [Nostocaceae]BAY72743.1 hypothetical protein NIES23_55710 [Trichormus variabilis NIES-23]MBD2174967.1 hypothetical protein [Anabaena cylindrica FACHB-318]MBD2266721.1 hypothetical protein [Anabaena sp. FACHB-709]MBD2276367.1 hypothetical protein [Nostoc sp. PCC 7120 = FACHB-418]MBD2286904.1 hypothetical protein [Anabaena cylindrica FACHB-170]